MKLLLVFFIGFGFGWLACGVREAGRQLRRRREQVFGYQDAIKAVKKHLYDQDEELP